MANDQIANPQVGVSGELVPENLKQKLLLFDQVAVIDLESAIGISRWVEKNGSEEQTFEGVANDLEYLVGENLLIDVKDPYEAPSREARIDRPPCTFRPPPTCHSVVTS